MNTPYLGIRELLSNAVAQAIRNVEYYDQRRVALGSIGIVAFPLYYWIWSSLFPQPYENLWLRIIGSLLFLPLVFSDRWPSSWKRHLPTLWYFALLYSLPFFFIFMLLKNDCAEVWVASVVVALFAMSLLLDWLSLITHFVFGTLLAWMLYAATTESAQISLASITYLPIFAFAVAVGAAANYASLMVRVEQERAMIATASGIAHELRTPLLSIAVTASGLGEYLPLLLKTYELAKSANLDVPPIRSIQIESMRNALKRVEAEAMHSNTIIDMLLMSARQTQRNGITLTDCSMRCCVETALERYPLSAADRSLITLDPGQDFRFSGNKLLMVHVIFNLIKNALRHIAKAGKGDIRISFRTDGPSNILLFRDTGLGIRQEHVSHIFSRFYTSTEDNDNILGAGIGLAFCRDAMTLFGGSISCRSTFNEFTEFELKFPAI